MKDVHRALWSGYVNLSHADVGRVPRGRDDPPLSRDAALPFLAGAKGVPRSVLTASALNILPDDREAAVPPALASLLMGLTGRTVDEIRDAGGIEDRLLIVAEQYGVLDYQARTRTQLIGRETSAKSYSRVRDRTNRGGGVEQGNADARIDPDVVAASFELCVQRPLEEMRAIIEPIVWSERCRLFWGASGGITVLEGGRAAAPTSEVTVEGRLKLPGGKYEAGAQVVVDLSVKKDAFGVINHYAFANDQIEVCQGVLQVTKELGRPGASRIVHEKRVLFAPGARASLARQTLDYWIQAETLSLVLPT